MGEERRRKEREAAMVEERKQALLRQKLLIPQISSPPIGRSSKWRRVGVRRSQGRGSRSRWLRRCQ
jgi:hypothetical protein